MYLPNEAIILQTWNESLCLETEHRERRGLHSLWKEAWSFSWGIFVTIYLPMRISTHLYCGQLLIDYVLLLNVSASQQNKCYITTQGGRLPCKRIIHFVAQDDIKFLVSKVLQECELQQYTSVTFPAIGTGLCLPSEMGSVHSADGFCWRARALSLIYLESLFFGENTLRNCRL